jgi:hypothetical protein
MPVQKKLHNRSYFGSEWLYRISEKRLTKSEEVISKKLKQHGWAALNGFSK